MNIALTKKQQAIVDYIRHYICDNACAPTCEDIRKEFGFASPNSVTSHLKLIEKKGYIKDSKGRSGVVLNNVKLKIVDS